MKAKRQIVSIFLISIVFVFQAAAQNKSGYHLLNKFQVGGDGGWDYLLAHDGRLYISRSTRVMVLDAETGKSIGEVQNTNGVHGIAIADDLGRGFTSNGRDNTVTIFDVKTLKPIGSVTTGKNPDAIIYDPFSKNVYAFNGRSNDATVIEASTGKVLATIALGGKPEFAASDLKGNVFVNIEDKSEVERIDAKKFVVTDHWPIAPGEEASGMAIDLKHHRLFVVCSNKKMIVLDDQSGKVIASPEIGDGPDAAAFDSESKLAFSSNGVGTLTIVKEVSEKEFTVIDNIATQRSARTMALDTSTHKLYLPAVRYGETPAATKDNPRPRPSVIHNFFTVLVFGK